MFGLIVTSGLVSLLYCPVALGMALAFRIVNYPDLTCEGSFLFGGGVAWLALENGAPPAVSICFGFLAGALAGVFTALLHVGLGVSRLLSGIITSAVLYSVTIHLLDGRANKRTTVPTLFGGLTGDVSDFETFCTAAIIAGSIFAILSALYQSNHGQILRVVGDQEWFCVSLGKNPRYYVMIGLGCANALIGLAGATIVHFKHVCDVNMGAGVLVSALAGVVLGETLYGARTLWAHSLMCVAGTLLYNIALGIFYFDWGVATETFLLPSDVRLVTGLLLIAPAAILKRVRHRYRLFNSAW